MCVKILKIILDVLNMKHAGVIVVCSILFLSGIGTKQKCLDCSTVVKKALVVSISIIAGAANTTHSMSLLIIPGVCGKGLQ